jgi:hypothetical protein
MHGGVGSKVRPSKAIGAIKRKAFAMEQVEIAKSGV